MKVGGIYIASKSKHAHHWRFLRDTGAPITCSWIDEAGEGETVDWTELWERCLREAFWASSFILYREEGEVLRGAYLELGAALAGGVGRVLWVGPEDGNISRNAEIRIVPDVVTALEIAAGRKALPPAWKTTS